MPARLEYNLDIGPSSRWNMVSATAMAKSALIYAQEIGDFRAGPSYYTSREEFASYLMKITVDGCGQLEYNGQTYLIPPGHFFLIDCKKPQYYRTAPEADNWHAMWVHFYGANAKAYYDAFLTHNNGSPIGLFSVPSKVLTIFTALLELDFSGHNQMMVDFQAASLLTQLLSECVLSTMTKSKASDVPHIIQSVRMYLLNHFQEKHTLEELGNRFSINPYYLQKQFKRYVGMSPSEYQIFLRMTKAKELIRNTKMPLGEIALAVGIENLGYFTRLFKHQENMTPQEYRKLWPGPDHGFQEIVFPERTDINKE
jgi:AraC-like DNA-binding protein